MSFPANKPSIQYEYRISIPQGVSFGFKPMNDGDNNNRVKFAKGTVLLDQGESNDQAHLIISGKVEIRAGCFGDSPKVLASRERGDIVGEMALIDNRPHMACVVAIEDTVTRPISRREFRERLDEIDPVMRGVMRTLARRLRDMSDLITTEHDDIDWGHLVERTGIKKELEREEERRRRFS